MPNWVKTRVIAMKTTVNFEKFTDEDGNFSLEKIVPMPKDIYRGSLGDKERAQYGEKNWYDWSIQHWGTKWDCNNSYISGNIVEFETAWTFPVFAMIALAKKVGTLFCLYADEDIGSNNCGGVVIFKNGKTVEVDPCTLFAQSLWNDGLPMKASDVDASFGWIIRENSE